MNEKKRYDTGIATNLRTLASKAARPASVTLLKSLKLLEAAQRSGDEQLVLQLLPLVVTDLQGAGEVFDLLADKLEELALWEDQAARGDVGPGDRGCDLPFGP